MYVHDQTQGPRCAIACAPALLYRNYLMKFPNGSKGQRSRQQLDNLDGLAALLGEKDQYWTNQNG